jgi:hypothetical protein
MKVANPVEFRANVAKKLEKYFISDSDNKSESNARNLEKGIFNWTIKEASNKKIIKKWDNSFFVRIYIDHLKSVFHLCTIIFKTLICNL